MKNVQNGNLRNTFFVIIGIATIFGITQLSSLWDQASNGEADITVADKGGSGERRPASEGGGKEK